jgi:hypothetical protein
LYNVPRLTKVSPKSLIDTGAGRQRFVSHLVGPLPPEVLMTHNNTLAQHWDILLDLATELGRSAFYLSFEVSILYLLISYKGVPIL